LLKKPFTRKFPAYKFGESAIVKMRGTNFSTGLWENRLTLHDAPCQSAVSATFTQSNDGGWSMKMRFPLLLLLSVLLIFSAGCSRKKSNVPEPTGLVPASTSKNRFTAGDVREAIIKGGAAKKWQIVDMGADTMQATITVNDKRTVVVSIPYTAAAYSIHYKDSTNMGYKAKDDGTFSINKNYNKLVLDLEQAIQKQIALKQMTM
jgi:hypothetical protein